MKPCLGNNLNPTCSVASCKPAATQQLVDDDSLVHGVADATALAVSVASSMSLSWYSLVICQKRRARSS